LSSYEPARVFPCDKKRELRSLSVKTIFPVLYLPGFSLFFLAENLLFFEGADGTLRKGHILFSPRFAFFRHDHFMGQIFF